MDLVEQRNGHSERDEVVAPDPLVLEVMLDRKLCQLRRKGVREFHRAGNWIRHFAAVLICVLRRRARKRRIVILPRAQEHEQK